MAMAVALLIFILAAPTVYGVDHTVGSSNGWTLAENYTAWAEGQSLKVGDNLVFNYESNLHSVDEVNKAAYDSCSSSNPIHHYTGGSTKIQLTTPGTLYFLCPTAGHCQGGMKLAVSVEASGGRPPSTPSPPGSTPSPTQSPPVSSNPPPPPENGADSAFGSVSKVVIGSAALLTAILGFM